jgi:hypothetical protein
MKTRRSAHTPKQSKVTTKQKNVKVPLKKKNTECFSKVVKQYTGIRPSADEAPFLNTICADIFMRAVLPFVGKNQYRFVGGVNRHFRISYFTVFSPSTSYENVVTRKQADLCCRDLHEKLSQRANLCKVMAMQGQETILKYLFTKGVCPLDSSMTAAAAKGGHFELMRWLVHNNFPVDSSTFDGAAACGDLAMFIWLYSPSSAYSMFPTTVQRNNH